MPCSNSGLIFAVFAVILFIVLFLNYGATESFNRRWPTSYYDQGDWHAKNQKNNIFQNGYPDLWSGDSQKRDLYKRYNLAMWDLV